MTEWKVVNKRKCWAGGCKGTLQLLMSNHGLLYGCDTCDSQAAVAVYLEHQLALALDRIDGE